MHGDKRNGDKNEWQKRHTYETKAWKRVRENIVETI